MSRDLGMIDPAACGAWRDVAAKLRPFVARRVRSEVDVDDVVRDVFLRMQRGLVGLRDDQRFLKSAYSTKCEPALASYVASNVDMPKMREVLAHRALAFDAAS